MTPSPPPRSVPNRSVPGCENVSSGRRLPALETAFEAGLQLPPHAVDPDAQGIHGDVQLLGEGLAVADVALSLVIAEHQVPLVWGQGREAAAEAVEPAV